MALGSKPRVYGADLLAADSATLSAMSVDGMTIGTTAYNSAVGSNFVLTKSIEDPVTDQILLVDGIIDARWILDEGGGGGGNDFVNGTPTFYASPNGNDVHPGTFAQPKLHIYDAVKACTDAGGGIVYVAEGCTVGGPVTGQGIRLRADYMPTGGVDGGTYFWEATRAQGFLPIVPMRIVGIGNQNGFGPFTDPTVAAFTAQVDGGADRNNPAIWIVGSVPMEGLVIENLQGPEHAQVTVRCGVDYDRNVDATPRTIAVASATRVGNQTTYTLTLPAGLAVTSAKRASGIVTLTVPNPGLPWPPFRGVGAEPQTSTRTPTVQGTPVRFSGATVGGAVFPAGDYILTGAANALSGLANWTVSYQDNSNPDVGNTAITATMQTHGLCAGELFDLTSTDPHFEGTQYYVDSYPTGPVDAATVTVTDVFNSSGDHTGSNIGTLLHQERFAGGTTNVKFRNVYAQCEQSNPASGPSWDIGHTQAMRPEIDRGWCTGYVGFGPDSERDERRMAAMYIYPGVCQSAGPPTCSAYVHDLRGSGGSVYFETGANNIGWGDVQRILIEQPFPSLALPALRVNGSIYQAIVADQAANADSTTTTPGVILEGELQPSNCQVTRSGIVSGPCLGGDTWGVGAPWVGPGTNWPTPWSKQQVTMWADGRITGKHPAAARAMGVLGARFKNIVQPTADWGLGDHTTLTTGIVAPDGSTTADELTTTQTELTTIHAAAADGNTWAVGGHFVVCGWVNAHGVSDLLPGGIFRVDLDGNVKWSETGTGSAHIPVPYTGTGWQFMSGYLTVSEAPVTNPDIIVFIGDLAAGATIDFWGLTAFYVPTSVYPNDVFEFLGTLKHQPRYLPAGASGTMEGGKLIGHGGLGTAARYTVGIGSGQITLGSPNGNAVEIFDETGTSLGVLALSDFTVNP